MQYEVTVLIRELCCGSGYPILDMGYIIEATNEEEALAKAAHFLKRKGITNENACS